MDLGDEDEEDYETEESDDEVESSEHDRTSNARSSKQAGTVSPTSSKEKSSPVKARRGDADGSESEETSESAEFLDKIGNSDLSGVVFANLSHAARVGSGIDEEVEETSDFALKTMEKLAFHYKQFSTGVEDVLFDQAYLEARKKGKKEKLAAADDSQAVQNRRGGMLMQGDIRDGHNAKNKSMMMQLLALQGANSSSDGTPRERLAFRSGNEEEEPEEDPVPPHEVHIKKTGRAYVHQNDRWRKPAHVVI